jgi:SAM-dependent methyltransferase
MDYLERSKKEWERASQFPSDKEEAYPMHTVVQEFDLHTGKVVYEYGCGGGSDMLSYLRRGNVVTGSDIVPRNLDVARERIVAANYTEGVDFELLLLENSYPIPKPDNHYDIISSHGVLHHIKDPAPVVRELFRICKPGGLIYVMLYSDVLWDHHWPRMEQLMKLYRIDQYEAFCWCCDGEGTPYARCYTTDEACTFLGDAGFTVKDYNYWLNDFFITVKGYKE